MTNTTAGAVLTGVAAFCALAAKVARIIIVAIANDLIILILNFKNAKLGNWWEKLTSD